MMKSLYYGDNLDVLRNNIPSDSVDLCYIDPPFNSKRNYNQIYNNIGKEDMAQAQAFVDTWTWDNSARTAFHEIINNEGGRFSQRVTDLIRGLHLVLQEGSLLAYLVSMTVRLVEIHRVLKPTGSFYLHCDPTASHYLKLVLDAIFLPNGGEYQNEIVWRYRRWTGGAKRFLRMHDTIFFYTKSAQHTFNRLFTPYTEKSLKRKQNYHTRIKGDDVYETSINPKGVAENDVWEIQLLNSQSKERLGYPTQKPEALLERIIMASSNEGDVVLDAYCGCGTTVAVAEKLNRSWIGIDITYQSVSLILQRLEKQYGHEITDKVMMNGIPRDFASAKALANKKDDRLRKEFEKWAILTYTNNRATVNDKKGADKGIDGTAYFLVGRDNETAKVVFQVKSGTVGRKDIAQFNSDRQRAGAELGIFITLEEPTKPMREEANSIGIYKHDVMGRSYPRIQIVTINEIVTDEKRMDIPLSFEVFKKAQSVPTSKQTELFSDDE